MNCSLIFRGQLNYPFTLIFSFAGCASYGSFNVSSVCVLITYCNRVYNGTNKMHAQQNNVVFVCLLTFKFYSTVHFLASVRKCSAFTVIRVRYKCKVSFWFGTGSPSDPRTVTASIGTLKLVFTSFSSTNLILTSLSRSGISLKRQKDVSNLWLKKWRKENNLIFKNVYKWIFVDRLWSCEWTGFFKMLALHFVNVFYF